MISDSREVELSTAVNTKCCYKFRETLTTTITAFTEQKSDIKLFQLDGKPIESKRRSHGCLDMNLFDILPSPLHQSEHVVDCGDDVLLDLFRCHLDVSNG